MAGQIYAVLGETELEIIAWLSGLEMRHATTYAEQALIGGKALLQHTGYAPDEVKIKVLLHAQWCQPAAELSRVKRLMDEATPVAFVLGSGEYRGVFVVTGLVVTQKQTDGSGVAIAFEADITLREYIGDAAHPSPPGVVTQGYRIPVGAMSAEAVPPPTDVVTAVTSALSAAGQVAAMAARVQSLASLASHHAAAAIAAVAYEVPKLSSIVGTLPVEPFQALAAAAATPTEMLESTAAAAAAFGRARTMLTESVGLLRADPLGGLPAASYLLQQAVGQCSQAAAPLSALARMASLRR